MEAETESHDWLISCLSPEANSQSSAGATELPSTGPGSDAADAGFRRNVQFRGSRSQNPKSWKLSSSSYRVQDVLKEAGQEGHAYELIHDRK